MLERPLTAAVEVPAPLGVWRLRLGESRLVAGRWPRPWPWGVDPLFADMVTAICGVRRAGRGGAGSPEEEPRRGSSPELELLRLSSPAPRPAGVGGGPDLVVEE